MDGRFDQEFYRSEWQRVLPLGPDGIQPYVRTSGTSRSLDPGRLVAIQGTTAQGAIAFARQTAIGILSRLPLAIGPREARQDCSLRLAHPTAHPAGRRAAAARCLSGAD
jgi:hypothetical protein